MLKLVRKEYLIYLVVFILLFIAYLYLRPGDQSYESTKLPKHLFRDYVLFDETREELQTLNTKINRRPNKVNIYKRTTNVYSDRSKQKVYLKTMKGKTPIFVHSAKDDNMISAFVRDHETWEEDLLNQTGEFVRRYPGITFLDLGCNIGVYTLFAAKLGIKVLSIDPVETNLKLLSGSLNAGNLAENVTLVFNAVSDEYKTVSIDIPKDNVGGAHIVVENEHDSKDTLVTAKTILLDDIIPYVQDDDVFIKMDVEGHEWNVIKGGQIFFQTLNVRAILMEWVHYRHQKNGQLIVKRLMRNGLLPYTDISMKEILDPDSYYMWPENVFWIKR